MPGELLLCSPQPGQPSSHWPQHLESGYEGRGRSRPGTAGIPCWFVANSHLEICDLWNIMRRNGFPYRATGLVIHTECMKGVAYCNAVTEKVQLPAALWNITASFNSLFSCAWYPYHSPDSDFNVWNTNLWEHLNQCFSEEHKPTVSAPSSAPVWFCDDKQLLHSGFLTFCITKEWAGCHIQLLSFLFFYMWINEWRSKLVTGLSAILSSTELEWQRVLHSRWHKDTL